MLAEYSRAIPGLGEKISGAFIAEGEHRREMDRRAMTAQEGWVKAEMGTTIVGMLLAFLIVALFAGVAIYAISEGHPWAGVAILGADLVALVTAFIVGRRAQVQETRAASDQKRE
jgi:uncharacterized membrane protein